MAYTLFIADLHLCQNRPDMTAAFMTFLHDQVTEACDGLYILGDFFEYWIGDDDNSPFHQRISAALRETARITPIYFIHGNRDFLLGQRFAQACHMTLLPEEHLVDLYGRKTLLMHGDSLCTDDLAYMKFRQKSRKKWWQTMMLALPLFVRRRIAKKAREKSRQSQQAISDMSILDVTPKTVLERMQYHHVDLLIHGHTHRPNIHTLHDVPTPGSEAQRIVLGDWYEQGSYLIFTPQTHDLKQLPLG